MGKLTENKIRNQAAILHAGFRLFSNRGFEATTIADIVKSSGLARGTFYNYFNNKEEIWEQLVGQFVAEVNQRLIEERAKATNIQEFTYNSFMGYAKILNQKGYLNFFIKNQPIFRKTISSQDVLVSVYNDLENDLKNKGYYNGLSDMQYRLIAHSMISTGIEIIFQTTNNQENSTLEELGAYFTDLFIGGYYRMIGEGNNT